MGRTWVGSALGSRPPARGALLAVTTLLAVAGLLALPAAPAEAQSGRSCRQVLRSDFRRIVNTRQQEIIYFRDPVRFLCTGAVRLEADSAVVNRSSSTVELLGNVTYQDSTRVLRAEWANYLGRMEQLLARGDVELEDLEGGALIQGDRLNYLQAGETRPVARMIVTGGRPYAVLPPARDRPSDGAGDPPGVDRPMADPPVGGRPVRPDSAGAPAEADGGGSGQADTVSTEVWADRLELVGEDVFRAEGDVELRRGADMTGGGREADFDQGRQRMTLRGTAFVQNPDYRLEGEVIDAFLEGDALREVLATEAARVRSEELQVEAERIRIGFVAGELERLEAWNPDPATAPRRVRATARDFRLRADSIDAQADSLGIRELRAVGRAYGEREGTDSVAPLRPVDPTVARDWIQGDTILGFFARVAPGSAPQDSLTRPGEEAPPRVAPAPDSLAAAGDSTEAVLERIVVVGGTSPALSLYRMAGDQAGDRPAINFMRASRIILFMERGDVARVEAEGPIEGLYLDPGSRGGGGNRETRSGGVGGRR